MLVLFKDCVPEKYNKINISKKTQIAYRTFIDFNTETRVIGYHTILLPYRCTTEEDDQEPFNCSRHTHYPRDSYKY